MITGGQTDDEWVWSMKAAIAELSGVWNSPKYWRKDNELANLLQTVLGKIEGGKQAGDEWTTRIHYPMSVECFRRGRPKLMRAKCRELKRTAKKWMMFWPLCLDRSHWIMIAAAGTSSDKDVKTLLFYPLGPRLRLVPALWSDLGCARTSLKDARQRVQYDKQDCAIWIAETIEAIDDHMRNGGDLHRFRLEDAILQVSANTADPLEKVTNSNCIEDRRGYWKKEIMKENRG